MMRDAYDCFYKNFIERVKKQRISTAVYLSQGKLLNIIDGKMYIFFDKNQRLFVDNLKSSKDTRKMMLKIFKEMSPLAKAIIFLEVI